MGKNRQRTRKKNIARTLACLDKNINEIQETLHSKDPAQREAARQLFLQYVDKVICAHYEGNFVVDHECQHGVMSGTAADFF